ncbi:MAG: universal stress protein [Deltaproteobacteria bacterium]|nr:universal stress protein [Deltaproteobacteria bacterium]
MSRFLHLFEPFDIPPVRLKNRITMAPLFTAYANPDGTVSELMLEHYREMAASGVAMVVVANASVEPMGALSRYGLRADHDRFVPGLFRLSKAIQGEGAVPVLQINHGGRFARTKNSYAPSAVPVSEMELFGAMRSLFKSSSLQDQWALVSDAILQFSDRPREMQIQDIRHVIGAYARAARYARDAGFHMVEIHGGTGYLPVQFLSPRTNRRKDRYGGDLNGRMRFPLELVEAVKSAVGDAFPVGYRFLADEWMPKGFSLDEATVLARELAAKEVAYLSVTAGTYESLSNPEVTKRYKRPGYLADLAGHIREAAGLPIIAAGRITAPQVAEKILKEQKADLIGLARPLFADPLWVKKALDGNARIVPCKGCNSCYRSALLDRPAMCPQWGRTRTIKRKSMIKELRNPYTKVLIAMDGSEHASMAAVYAGDMLPRNRDLSVTLLYIRTDESQHVVDRIQSVLEEARAILMEADIARERITINIKKKKEGVARDILAEISAGGFGTVVVGRRGMSRAEQFLFGSVSSKILQNARDCTVWLVD